MEEKKADLFDIENVPPCSLYKVIQSIKGLASNSASPSDSWILHFKNESVYRTDGGSRSFVNDAFLKLSLTYNGFAIPSRAKLARIEVERGNQIVNQIHGLVYERQVYKLTSEKFEGICPHFLRCYNTGTCTYAELEKLAVAGGLSINNLHRNIFCMYYGFRRRPAVDGDFSNEEDENSFEDYAHAYKYYDTFEKYVNMMEFTYVITYFHPKAMAIVDVITPKHVAIPLFYNLLFQVVYGCYCMSKIRMSHNDLHYGNVLLKPLKGADMVYKVGRKTFKFEGVKLLAQIFDFDRAYVESFGENKQLTKTLATYSQENKFVRLRDVIKFMCYFHRKFDDDTMIDLLDLKGEQREYWLRVLNLGQCFLEFKENNAVPEKKYNEIPTTYLDILANIHKKYVSLGGSTKVGHDPVTFHCFDKDFPAPKKEAEEGEISEEKKED